MSTRTQAEKDIVFTDEALFPLLTNWISCSQVPALSCCDIAIQSPLYVSHRDQMQNKARYHDSPDPSVESVAGYVIRIHKDSYINVLFPSVININSEIK